MKKRYKQTLVPVSVSQVVPVYRKKRICGWNVHVFYDGDLSTNTASRQKWKEFVDKNPYLVHECGYMLRPVLRHDIAIPNGWHLTGFCKYHQEDNTFEMEYSWRNGLFGLGAKRAWNFRTKMLSKVNKQKIK